MRIEPMQRNHIEQVIKLAGQLGYPNTQDHFTQRFERVRDNESVGLFVATAQEASGVEKVIGWVQVNQEAGTLLSDPRAEITALVVDEDARGEKVGKSLLGYAEQWAKERSFNIVRLRSNVKRSDAHRFYLREGYEIQKSWHLFTKELK